MFCAIGGRSGRACLTGYLENVFEAEQAKQAAARLGIELRRYSSSVVNADSYGNVMQEIVDGVQEGRLRVNLDHTFPLDQVAEAHRTTLFRGSIGSCTDELPRPDRAGTCDRD